MAQSLHINATHKDGAAQSFTNFDLPNDNEGRVSGFDFEANSYTALSKKLEDGKAFLLWVLDTARPECISYLCFNSRPDVMQSLLQHCYDLFCIASSSGH